MSKKVLYLLLPILFLVISASIVRAEDSTTGSARPTVDAATKLKQQMQLIQEQKRDAITQVKDDTQAFIQTRREEFKAKLQLIKDEKKRALTERIDLKITEFNKNHTVKYAEVLTRIQGFLDEIRQSTINPKILSEISTAQTAIDTAKAAVDAQAAKTYDMAITDDMTLRVKVGAIVSQFRQDLMNVHKLVVDAKQAVQKLRVEKPIIEREATESGKG